MGATGCQTRGPDFPSKVLAHHWPHVPNLGDMTKIDGTQYRGTDVLVGGTPCQAYSVAGLRQGLADPRGNLTLTFAKLVHEMQPRVVLWENVPGVLTSDDNAFGCFLSALCGNDEPAIPESEPTEQECNYNAKTPTTKRKHYRWSKRTGRFVPKWPATGYVAGPDRICAWRVLDAQFFGVAQRRRRVFLVSVDTRSGLCPGKILFEPESQRRDTPPSRETKSVVANCITTGIGNGDRDAQTGHLVTHGFRMTAFGEYVEDGTASTSKARDYKDATDLTVQVVHGTQDPCVSDDIAFALGRNNGGENVVMVPPRVRRLTPTEAEWLQGFPGDHTNIPGAVDGPRYKAIGNSMAVIAMRWLGVRIILALEGLI